jgi:histidinol-phosphate aminotransferase
MPVRLRPSLASLPSYVAGRSVPGAIKLASNESSYGPLPHVLQRTGAAATESNRYPDNGSAELSEVLAERFKVAVSQVAVGCGSVSLCQQLVLAAAGTGDEVVYGWRSFEAYPIITTVGGADSVRVPLADDVYDLAAMADAVTDRTRLIFVCNPNNPTGTVVGGDELLAFLDRVPADVLVALDEAYIEYVTDPRVIRGTSLLERYPNIVVLRTFSKAYGLAGLRVGFAIAADPAVSAGIRQTQIAFAVSRVAQAAAMASLEPPAEEQLLERVDQVTAERRRVTAALRDSGYHLPEPQANFVWLGHGAASDGLVDAVAFGQGCEDRGLIVRVFAGDGVRVTIGTADENDSFIEAARAIRGT